MTEKRTVQGYRLEWGVREGESVPGPLMEEYYNIARREAQRVTELSTAANPLPPVSCSTIQQGTVNSQT